jgi:integrase
MDVDPQDWDSEAGRFKGTNSNFHYLNFKLSEVEGKLQEIYYSLERQKLTIVASMLKDVYQGKKLDSCDYSLLSFLDYFILEAKAKPQIYGHPTINHYNALKSHLENFFKSMRIKDVPLESFNRNMLDRFENWLLSWQHPVLERAMNENTKNNYLKKLKSVINNAIRKELIVKNPFIGFTLKEVKGKKVFLSEEELSLLAKHDLGGNASLIKVRDIFMFSVYSGLRWSDAVSLRNEHISIGEDGNLWITKDQIKTQEALHIPLLKPAEEIYRKYEGQQQITGFVLPRPFQVRKQTCI